MTYTCAKLELSKSAFDEITRKLRDAGYDHAFIDEGIDMTHIMVARTDHSDHGRGDNSGPHDPDCPCRNTESQKECGEAGCGFCTAMEIVK